MKKIIFLLLVFCISFTANAQSALPKGIVHDGKKNHLDTTHLVQLWRSYTQEHGGHIGTYVYKDLKKEYTPADLNLMKYLLSHQELIPINWRKFSIYFWSGFKVDKNGDPIPAENGNLCIPFITWSENKWINGTSIFSEISGTWEHPMPALVYKK